MNGRRASADQRVEDGDVVRIPPIRTAAPAAGEGGGAEAVARARAALAARLEVLYEDESLIAVAKPAGVAVHGGSGVSSGVIEQLRAARPEARFLELVHRLDRETSGVLLVAKKRQALLGLQAQLRARETDKRYLAVVAGRWPLRTKTIAFPLRRLPAPGGDRRVVVHEEGQEAITRVTGLRRVALEGLGEFTLVEAKIETGRTHQIRVHLSHAGFPIAGDDKYGDFGLNKALEKIGFKRMYLHAFSIVVHHPEDGRALRFEAPPPEDFQRLLDAGGAGDARVEAAAAGGTKR